MGSLKVELESASDSTEKNPYYRARIAPYSWQYGISKQDAVQNAVAYVLRMIASNIELGRDDSPVDQDGYCALEIAIYSKAEADG